MTGDEEVTSPGGEREGGIGDFVRRAVSAGVGAASRSKDDIMRVAAGEVRSWLERLNLNDELAKALAKMVIEVKTEIRFRPNEDGKLVPETTNDVKVKRGSKPVTRARGAVLLAAALLAPAASSAADDEEDAGTSCGSPGLASTCCRRAGSSVAAAPRPRRGGRSSKPRGAGATGLSRV